VRRCASEELPSALRRSEGISIVSEMLTPGMRTSEKPTPEAPCIDSRPDHVVASIVIRSVVKLRSSNRIVWPPVRRDAAVSAAWTACPPSKLMVTPVIRRFTVEPSTCTRLR